MVVSSSISLHGVVIDLICPKVDHKIEIIVWRTQIMSKRSLLQILMKSGGKSLKINSILV